MSRLSVWLLKAIRCPDIALKYVPWQKDQGILFEIHWVWTELSEFYGNVQTHCIFKSSLEYRHAAKPFSSFFATLSLCSQVEFGYGSGFVLDLCEVTAVSSSS